MRYGGKPLVRGGKVRASSEVIAIVAAVKCENLGIVFYRAPNGVILSAGLRGIAPPERFLCVRRLRDYEVSMSHSPEIGIRKVPRISHRRKSSRGRREWAAAEKIR